MKGHAAMNWKFWKKTDDPDRINRPKFVKPKELPEAVGRKMVVGMKMDPDLVWSLKYLSRPVEGRKNTYEFRIVNPETVRQAGVIAKDWSSFDERPDLVMYTGYYDKNGGRIDIT
jgi:hypothetical protein